MKLVECVPNFSEGRDQSVLDAISQAIRDVEGVQLLDVDPGRATNRTVFTFVGEPEAVLEAAFQAVKTAAQRIDMTKHTGEHARMGATDVCPFVPLEGTNMQDCIALAQRLGERVGKDLGIPVFLYEEAATRPERRNLATIRAGEYEGLAAKLADPEWQPDYGPAECTRAGATAIGAREFLVAYNINLNTRDKRLATDVALEIREAGRNKRGPDGKFVRDENGVPIKRPGLFKHVKAVGWYIDEYQRAQISINFTNLKVSPIHAVFDAACTEAEKRGLRVTGSELVGLVPLNSLLEAGRHYLRKQNRSTGVPEHELVHVAVRSLGLDELGKFDANDKIIEYRVRKPGSARLISLPVSDFCHELASESAAPGGGSVAALVGSLGAALSAMVANLTHHPLKKKLPLDELDALAVEAQLLKDEFLVSVDEDTNAFTGLMDAMRLPQKTAEQKNTRNSAIRESTRIATLVPLRVLEKCPRVVRLADQAARIGNPASLSDAGVSALCASAAASGAYYNVLINLGGIDDPDESGFVSDVRDRARKALRETVNGADDLSAKITARLEADV